LTEKLDRLWAPWRLEYIKTTLDPKMSCFLCDAIINNTDRESLLLFRSKQTFVIMNRYPYNNGHLLVSPNKHIADLDDLTLEELTELFDLVRRAKGWLSKAYKPHGFNIGVNIGHVAGAGLPEHVHVHIVPRWDGDVNFMPVLGGVKVIPEGLQSSYDQLRKVIDSV